MEKPQWTKEQNDAITARGGTLLVSAAAGSGKTAVLVERVVGLITDKDAPCGVDELLIVTFTNAAAAEMRERIDSALSALIEEQPENLRLQQQQLLLPGASICTIDSFCKDLLREQFHVFDIPQDFKILEQAQLQVLEEKALKDVLEEGYREKKEGFLALAEQLSTGRDDRPLGEAVRRLHTYIMAHPFPLSWLREKSEMYTKQTPLSQSVWGCVVLSYGGQVIDYVYELLEAGVGFLERDETLAEKSAPGLRETMGELARLSTCVKKGAWDETMERLSAFSFGRFVTPRGYAQHVDKLSACAKRDEGKKKLDELKKLFCASEAEHREDAAALGPVAESLVDLVERYDKRLMELKLRQGGLSFSDIEHYALRLLVQETETGWEKTALARELSRRYRELLVDEYQDTNEAQDMLFSALSKNEENLFMVGDVKQSIYRFRQAMPDIFLARRARLTPYTGRCPGRIVLDKNFRSRSGVAQMVNFVFENLMSREVGELDYDENERLSPAAQYPEGDTPDCEIHVIESSEKPEEEGIDTYEARYLSELVLRLTDGTTFVSSKEGRRPARFGDICILFRSASTHIPNYVAEFSRHGIPVCAQAADGLFAAPEVMMLLSLLRVIDNPMQDVPLLSLLVSSIYGFTPDDLSKIRLTDRGVSFYTALCTAGRRGDKKAREVLSDLEHMRTLAAAMPTGELVRRLCEDMELFALVSALPNPQERIANLLLLQEYAQRFEQAGVKGLSAFLRFLDKLEQQKGTLPGAAAQGGTNAVRFMSIHHSKGLEFPICILAGTARRFNTQSLRESLLLHPKLGFGLKRRDARRRIQFETVPYQALKISTQTAELSEALRVLYVAMTRAKERLIVAASLEAPQKTLAKLAARLTPGRKPGPFQVRSAGSDSDWLLTCALMHPHGEELRRLAGCGDSIVQTAEFPLRIVCAAPAGAGEEREDEAQRPPVDKTLYREMEERLSYVYPYAALASVAAKRGASELSEEGISMEYFASSRPAFLNQQGMTPAERGTALHKFMQFCRYEAAKDAPSEEITRLVRQGFLKEEEGACIPEEKLNRFFESPLACRMFQSGTLLREQKFTTMIPASRYEKGLEHTREQILVQGIADCVFMEQGKIVIVDYKTDRVSKEEELVRRYSTQMEVYAEALEKMFQMPVGEIWLYSFHMEKAVPVRVEQAQKQLVLPGF